MLRVQRGQVQMSVFFFWCEIATEFLAKAIFQSCEYYQWSTLNSHILSDGKFRAFSLMHIELPQHLLLWYPSAIKATDYGTQDPINRDKRYEYDIHVVVLATILERRF